MTRGGKEIVGNLTGRIILKYDRRGGMTVTPN